MVAEVKILKKKTEVTKDVLRELISKGTIDALPTEPEITKIFTGIKYEKSGMHLEFKEENDSIYFEGRLDKVEDSNTSARIIDGAYKIFRSHVETTAEEIIKTRGGEVK